MNDKELMQTLRELILDGYTGDEIMHMLTQIQIQLARITTGGND
jgi:hypothetical protein